MKKADVQNILETLNNEERIRVLLTYGHALTILARDSYDFQGSGITKPKLLREINEINHRIYLQVLSLINDTNNSENDFSIIHWITAEGKDEEVRNASIQAFKMAIAKSNT